MKDSKAKFEEWWEVAKEYFIKESDNNVAQHRANERFLRYKLEVYQKNFLDFICGSPTSIEVSSQDEESEARPGGIAQEEEVQFEEPQGFKSGVAQEEVHPKTPHDLRGGGQEKKKPKGIQEQEKVELIPTPREEISKI